MTEISDIYRPENNSIGIYLKNNYVWLIWTLFLMSFYGSCLFYKLHCKNRKLRGALES